jgi:hypothetical protein
VCSSWLRRRPASDDPRFRSVPTSTSSSPHVHQVELLAPRPLYRDATCFFCDRCGCLVDTDLIHPDRHQYAEEGDFYCADCWVES